ncbi:probable glucan endo-1,3-beta-glucosidase BG4 isoform X1 [Macadamia integrifolia]|uniref:probable glucan endo-1,3-beta-glucosidase BG4 isoform X1 n=2 Tax=Macadamia integrifolia TaxID=60698 RepID=UPI001C52D608|nr:probable glucan endo-1,3-beta-glucosidase BG4 isoform X1 [Macadamia integrifolia]
MNRRIASFIFFTLIATTCQAAPTRNGMNIGVCYGLLGNDLPPAPQVVSLYKRCGIQKMRLYNPNHEALEALRGSQIQVTLGVPNEEIPNLANSQEAAQSWFTTNVEPYIQDIEFSCITVGNEAFPGQFGPSIGPAMHNLKNVLNEHNLHGIQVTTVIYTAVLANSYPPSAAVFTAEAASSMPNILQFLSDNGAPIMLNVYPYFAYAGDPTNVRLDYALFSATGPVVQDGALSYSNIFDAMVDAFIWAMEKMGFPNVAVAISESGWPSAGNGDFTTPDLAGTYNRNFMNHIIKSSGTPKRPNTHMDAHIYAMFNENQKPNGTEQHFGLFYPNMQPVYLIFP